MDPTANYVSNISVYLGKNNFEGPRQCNVGESVVLSLSGPLFHSGRNIVADNFFSSFSLAQKLLDKKLTFLGTVRKNKKEIPPCLILSKKRSLYSSIFAFHEKYMMTSYVCKKGKAVIMLSTSTTDNTVTDASTNFKPQTIMHYNRTKGGVDNVDRMLASVSTRRWPLIVFYNMIDISLINAFALFNVIFKCEKKSRRNFLKEMSEELYNPLLNRNASKVIKRKLTKSNIRKKITKFQWKIITLRLL